VRDFLARDFLGLLEQEETPPAKPKPVSAKRIRQVLSLWTGKGR
jgi:hypothetical protein